MGDEIIKVLDDLCEKFGIAIDWSSKKVLPYIQELCDKCVRYEINTSIMWLVFAAILLAIGIALVIISIKIDDIDASCGCMVFACLFLILATIIMFYQIHDIIACKTFPEHILIRYVENNL